ncbi:hypothetical protein ZWY2020_058442 [Hordeum vulgare]|nr:hypothetical protein ZWY2020_058442 [Hordeum vulgare]
MSAIDCFYKSSLLRHIALHKGPDLRQGIALPTAWSGTTSPPPTVLNIELAEPSESERVGSEKGADTLILTVGVPVQAQQRCTEDVPVVDKELLVKTAVPTMDIITEFFVNATESALKAALDGLDASTIVEPRRQAILQDLLRMIPSIPQFASVREAVDMLISISVGMQEANGGVGAVSAKQAQAIAKAESEVALHENALKDTSEEEVTRLNLEHSDKQSEAKRLRDVLHQVNSKATEEVEALKDKTLELGNEAGLIFQTLKSWPSVPIDKHS